MSLGTKLLLSLLLLLGGAYVGYVGYRMWDRGREPSGMTEVKLKPERPLDTFEFTERDESKVKLTDLAGKVVVVNFFFVNCPGMCRQFTSTIAGLQEEFKDEPDVRFVSITVDPEKDTPHALKTYADQFGADAKKWWFVTAPLRDTMELGHSLHVNVVGSDHTFDMVLLDRNQTMRGGYDFRFPNEIKSAKTKIKELLAEKPGAEAKPSGTTAAASSATTNTAK